MKKLGLMVLILIVLLVGAGLLFVKKDEHLRGDAKPSKDGKTYLVVADDNGGGCGPVILDGKTWPHKLHEAGEVTPGVHTIKCGGELEFEIPGGTTFTFDYWGP